MRVIEHFTDEAVQTVFHIVEGVGKRAELVLGVDVDVADIEIAARQLFCMLLQFGDGFGDDGGHFQTRRNHQHQPDDHEHGISQQYSLNGRKHKIFADGDAQNPTCAFESRVSEDAFTKLLVLGQVEITLAVGKHFIEMIGDAGNLLNIVDAAVGGGGKQGTGALDNDAVALTLVL